MTNVFDYGDLTPDNHHNFLKVKLTSNKYCSSEFHINKSTLNLKQCKTALGVPEYRGYGKF